MITSIYLVKKLVLPTFCSFCIQGSGIGAVTSLYLLCCILRIVKIKDLANTIVAAFFCPQGAFVSLQEAEVNGKATSYKSQHSLSEESTQSSNGYMEEDDSNLKLAIPEDVSLQDNWGDLSRSLR